MGERLISWKNEILLHKGLIALSIVFLIIAIFLDYAAGWYVTKTPGVAVPDLLLDHLPTLDLDLIFIYGYILVIAALFLYPLFFKVKELHRAISQFSLLVMIRSFFTILTHLQVPAEALKFKVPQIISVINFQNDLFFSGHTAIPFLGCLLFRKEKIGKFFLLATVIMGATVLLMHVHYSIDVFAALFIAYGTFQIGNWLFRKVNHY